MATQYELIYNENSSNLTAEHLKLPAAIGSPDASLPGQKILTLAGGPGATFRELYDAFLVTPERVGWEWRPSGSGYSANRYGILDGTKLFGECLHFAYALWMLARAPKPFGLGLPHSQVQVSSYKGATGQGFVSQHGHRYLKLSKNVKRPPGNLDRLYYWENHKTVFYQNLFYDICYMTTYSQESDMAAYMLTGDYAKLELPELAEQASRVPDQSKFWFRRIQPSDHITNPRRSWIGPLEGKTYSKK
jgi:hypothetical protein